MIFYQKKKKKKLTFFLFLHEMYAVGTHYQLLLMSTPNICFHGEIEQYLSG